MFDKTVFMQNLHDFTFQKVFNNHKKNFIKILDWAYIYLWFVVPLQKNKMYRNMTTLFF